MGYPGSPGASEGEVTLGRDGDVGSGAVAALLAVGAQDAEVVAVVGAAVAVLDDVVGLRFVGPVSAGVVGLGAGVLGACAVVELASAGVAFVAGAVGDACCLGLA